MAQKEQTAVTYSRWLKTDDYPPDTADPPSYNPDGTSYNPDGTEGYWDLRGLSVVHFDFRNEVRYVWAWQWVRT